MDSSAATATRKNLPPMRRQREAVLATRFTGTRVDGRSSSRQLFRRSRTSPRGPEGRLVDRNLFKLNICHAAAPKCGARLSTSGQCFILSYPGPGLAEIPASLPFVLREHCCPPLNFEFRIYRAPFGSRPRTEGTVRESAQMAQALAGIGLRHKENSRHGSQRNAD